MKNPCNLPINSLPCRGPKWSSRLNREKGVFFVTVVLGLLLLFGARNNASAQGNILETKGNLEKSTICGNPARCCVLFTFRVLTTTDELDITLKSTGSPLDDNCWDWACFTGQAGATFKHTPIGHIIITFSPALVPASLPKETDFSFWLCPKSDQPGCQNDNGWRNFDWQSSYMTTQNGSGTNDTLYSVCDAEDGPSCGSCDIIQVTGDHVCVTHGSGGSSPVTSFYITFDPPAPSCLNASNVTPTSWSGPTFNTARDQLTFTTTGAGLQPCDKVCFDLPACADQPNHIYHLQAYMSPSPTPCPPTSGVFKTGTGHSEAQPTNDGLGNYPNPLSGSSAFKTTIPFVTAGAGIAQITIMNEAGQKVFSDQMELLGAGKHFFYFTGDRLPAGKYLYQIEYPEGTVIVNKSLLIVK